MEEEEERSAAKTTIFLSSVETFVSSWKKVSVLSLKVL
jgi:hypothetical protein